MREKSFAIFILSHGRPDRVYTLGTLKRGNYTGRVIILIDDEDKTAERYRELYGEQVITFSKEAIARVTDEGDNFKDRRVILYARNACFEVARQMGLSYFMQLDDDYFTFCYRVDSRFNYKDSTLGTHVKDIDLMLDLLLDYYKSIPAKSLAIAQAGDYLGGKLSDIHSSIGRRRKAMNSFICSTRRPFGFIGRINEDVNAYTVLGNRGDLFLTFPLLAIQQKQTQTNKGGMTDVYMNSGTYVKSFYTVMMLPSAVHVGLMGQTHRRLHHVIDWEKAVPCIIEEKHRKRRKLVR